MMPPCLRSSWPRRSPLCSTTRPRRKPVGGRIRQRVAREQAQQRPGAAARGSNSSATGVAGGDAPHRPAVDEHRDEDQRLLLGRVLHPAARDAPPGLLRAHEADVAGARAVRVGRLAARGHAVDDATADRVQLRADRRCSSASPYQTIALSTSELGTASRRAWLPSARKANGDRGSPSSATASSTRRRVSASSTTE